MSKAKGPGILPNIKTSVLGIYKGQELRREYRSIYKELNAPLRHIEKLLAKAELEEKMRNNEKMGKSNFWIKLKLKFY